MRLKEKPNILVCHRQMRNLNHVIDSIVLVQISSMAYENIKKNSLKDINTRGK